MANLTPEPSAVPLPSEQRPQDAEKPKERFRFLALLDSLLSPALRAAPPTELVRHRLVVGAASFLLLFNALYVLSNLRQGKPIVAGLIVSLFYLGVLVLARRGSSPTAPAAVLVSSLSLGLVGAVYTDPSSVGGYHAVTMLLPALAVYLAGPRVGLLVTLFLCGALGIGHPLYRIDASMDADAVKQMWVSHIFAALSFVGAWGLGALHATARDAAQASLERTLKKLREGERKLSSLIESTDDPVASMDTQGRTLIANSAMKALYRKRYGLDLEQGMPLFGPMEPARLAVWQPRLAQVLSGQRERFEQEYAIAGTHVVLDISIHPIQGEGGQVEGLTVFGRDITVRKEAEARLGEMHRTLVDVSRQAGMAEIATGVLHNVGNTLNSVNISTGLVIDQLRQSRVVSLTRATQLLREHSDDMATFLTQSAQGQKLPGFLIALGQQLQDERDTMLKEMTALNDSVDHIKSIVTMQQKHARTAGTLEQVTVPQLIDEALRLNAGAFDRHGIRIVRDYADVPSILVDRHKLLQILVNLLSNARHALVESLQPDKRVEIRVGISADGKQLLMEVADNGMGIAPEVLGRMFTQGFTTKKTGHGFGLHISSLAATEMNGKLYCSSPGKGQGATFTLELPLEPGPASA
jgi:PAS domain S-box-containing protein